MKKKINYLVLCALGFVLSWTFPATLKVLGAMSLNWTKTSVGQVSN